MKNTYETMVLLDNREVKRGWDALKNDVTSMFTKHGGEVVSSRVWGERRLAYPIEGQLRATYLLLYHNTPPGSMVAINRDLMYSESVLRHMTTVCDAIPEDAYAPEAEFDPEAVRTGEEEGEDDDGDAVGAALVDDDVDDVVVADLDDKEDE